MNSHEGSCMLNSMTLPLGMVNPERVIVTIELCNFAAWSWDQVEHSGCLVSIGPECNTAAIDLCRFWQQQPNFCGYWCFIQCSWVLHWQGPFISISTQGFQVQCSTHVLVFDCGGDRHKTLLIGQFLFSALWKAAATANVGNLLQNWNWQLSLFPGLYSQVQMPCGCITQEVCQPTGLVKL